MHDLHFPRVWCEFSGKRTGKRYRIQDAEDRHHNDVKHFMVKYFLNEEPTCKYQNCGSDEGFINELDVVWSECLRENLSIVCLDEDDKNGNTVVGFLLLTKATKTHKNNVTVINEKWAKIRDIMEYITIEAEPFKKLNVEEFLTDLGLLVLPDYRKDGVGEKLLLACDVICKEHDLPATVITFSSYKSQNLAKKIGFNELYSKEFEELRRINPKKLGIDNIEEDTKDIKYMYRTYNSKSI